MPVYFVQAGDGGPVKIGFSEKPEYRLSKMQADCPHALQLIALVDGDRDREAELHEEFAAHRRAGEWFDPAEAILAFCSEHRPARSSRLTSEFPIISKLGGTIAVCSMLSITFGSLRVQASRGRLSSKQMYKLMEAADARGISYTVRDFLVQVSEQAA